MKSLICALLLISTFAFGAKSREWKTGKLVALEQTRMPDDTNIRVSHIDFISGEYEYFAESPIKVAWHHGPRLTENGELKWQPDGDNIRVLDENNKEFKFRLIKKRKL